ncbi:hypothetical protein J2S43_002966 [Catenuloplanes nepalensis]|uniref:Uncharacterized protein n=1 Tax=Catenuloplanes nepalensis TaxID=587533 RepID=A0ABT9MSN3_9ACTN|nr:hypothetical protein [Catenuloplanes nepalensis]
MRRLTVASPHSYERASCLRSLLLLDPECTTALLLIHLLDCEPEVRLLADRYAPLTHAGSDGSPLPYRIWACAVCEDRLMSTCAADRSAS